MVAFLHSSKCECPVVPVAGLGKHPFALAEVADGPRSTDSFSNVALELASES